MAQNSDTVTETCPVKRSQQIDAQLHSENRSLHKNIGHLLADIPISTHPKVAISLPDHGTATQKPMRLNMPNLLSLVDKSHSKEAEQLQNVVNGLLEKVQTSETRGEEIKKLRQEVDQSLKERAALQAQIDKATKELRQEGSVSNTAMNKLKGDRDASKADESQRKGVHNDLKNQLGMERSNGQNQKRNVTITKGKRGNSDNIIEHTKHVDEHLERSEKNRETLSNNLANTQNAFANENSAQNAQIDALRKEIEQLRSDSAALSASQDDFTKQITSQKNDMKQANDQATDNTKSAGSDKSNAQEAAFKAEMKTVTDNFTAEIQNFVDETNAEREEFNRAHAAKLVKQMEAEQKYMKEWEAAMAAIKAELEAEIAQVEADAASTDSAHAADTEKLQADLKASLNELALSKQNTLDDFRKAKDAEIDELKAKNAQLTQELNQLKASIKIESDQIEMIQAAGEKCQQSEAARKEKQHALEKDTDDFEAQSNIFRSTMEGSLETNKQLSANLNSNREQLETATSYHHRQVAKQHDRTNNAVTLEQRCCMKEDLHQVLESKDRQNEHHRTVNGQLDKELGSAHEFIVASTEKSMEDHQNYTNNHETLQQKHQEAEYLKALILELKKRRPVYVPVKEDIVDVAVGEFVNTREDPLVVPFLREDHEIYNFGTKRVYVKLEKGKVIIRVGGGFMQLAEFIEIYTPVELEKQENRLGITNSPEQKKIMAKMIDSHMARVEPMSPSKAAKIIHGTVENKYVTSYGVRKLSPERERMRSQSPDRQ